MATDTDVFPYAVGGVERFVPSLAMHMAAAGATVEVVCARESTAEPTEVTSNGYKLVRLSSPGGRPSILRRFRRSRVIGRYLREREGSFDVVYGHRDALWGYLSGPHLPCIVNFHGMENFQDRRLLRRLRGLPSRLVERYQTIPRCDRVISLGGHLTTLLVDGLGIPAQKVAEVPNGVDLELVDRYRPVGGRTRGNGTWLFVGRLAYNKGLPVLVNAFRRASPQGINLLIVGDGPLRARLEALAQGSEIKFAGRVPDADLFALYHASEAFVFPTENEGMPTVILEAMACGLPIVASDIGAVRTMVTSQNGRLTIPGSVEDLAEAMRWLSRLSPDQRLQMGQASRRMVESHFTWKMVAEQSLQLCEQVVAQRRVRSFA